MPTKCPGTDSTVAAEELLDAVRHLPDQVRDAAVAAADVEGLPGRGAVSEVVMLGRGVGGVASDVVEMVAERHCSLPVLATGATVPSWLGESSLALAMSQSGSDRATVEAARKARASGATVVAITSGGELMSSFARWGAPVVRIDPGAGPAAGLGVVTVPALVLLERMGLADGMSQLISAAAAQLDARRQLMDASLERIEAMAASVDRRVAVVCGAGAVGKLAARRWVQELDRVGGVASIRRKAPVDDADVQTWVRLGQRVPTGVAAVVLRHDFEPEGLTDAIDHLEGRVSAVFEVTAAGVGALAQLLDLVLVGDAVAAAVAVRRAHPGPG